jgi:ATP-dependent Clp protease ATP-binding subunit ClpA
VVNKFILELEVQLEPKKVSLVVDQAARDWLMAHGYDREMGARPMARLIQENIKKPLAEELLFGRVSNGGQALFTVKEGNLHLEMSLEKDKAAAHTADEMDAVSDRARER